jgi:hypothetical protein
MRRDDIITGILLLMNGMIDEFDGIDDALLD